MRLSRNAEYLLSGRWIDSYGTAMEVSVNLIYVALWVPFRMRFYYIHLSGDM